MGETHREAGQAFGTRLKDEHPESVEQILLFGSAATGETQGRDSDVDVLVTLSSPADNIREQIHRIAFEVTMEYGVTVTPHVLTEQEYDTGESAIVETVQRDGLAL